MNITPTTDGLPPEEEPINEPVQGAAEKEETAAPALPKKGVFPKVENPKSEQFTGRSTKTEAERINEALVLRKQEGKTYDIVRFCLDMMDHIEADFLQTFKTKKKR